MRSETYVAMPPLRDVMFNRMCMCQRSIFVSMSRNKAFGTLLEFWLDILIMFKIVVFDLFFISIISRLYCFFRLQFSKSCLSLFLLHAVVFASIKYMVLQRFGCSLIFCDYEHKILFELIYLLVRNLCLFLWWHVFDWISNIWAKALEKLSWLWVLTNINEVI